MVELVHPDDNNYEGRKILVFCGVAIEEIKAQERIDPHFCEGKHISPFARFEPTEKGWETSVRVATMMSSFLTQDK